MVRTSNLLPEKHGPNTCLKINPVISNTAMTGLKKQIMTCVKKIPLMNSSSNTCFQEVNKYGNKVDSKSRPKNSLTCTSLCINPSFSGYIKPTIDINIAGKNISDKPITNDKSSGLLSRDTYATKNNNPTMTSKVNKYAIVTQIFLTFL